MSLLPFCQWIAETRWSVALHESLWVYPLVESTHVWSSSLFVGLPFSWICGSWVSRCGRRRRRSSGGCVRGWSRVLPHGRDRAPAVYAIPVGTYQSVFFRLTHADRARRRQRLSFTSVSRVADWDRSGSAEGARWARRRSCSGSVLSPAADRVQLVRLRPAAAPIITGCGCRATGAMSLLPFFEWCEATSGQAFATHLVVSRHRVVHLVRSRSWGTVLLVNLRILRRFSEPVARLARDRPGSGSLAGPSLGKPAVSLRASEALLQRAVLVKMTCSLWPSFHLHRASQADLADEGKGCSRESSPPWSR
jgi:hypothetical protein